MPQPNIVNLVIFYNQTGQDDAYHSVAGLLLQNMRQLGSLTIQDTAARCFTSAATITRVARKAGYRGYNELREAAKYSCQNAFAENRILPPEMVKGRTPASAYLAVLYGLLDKLTETLDARQFQQAASLLNTSDHIYFLFAGNEMRILEQDLFYTGKFVDSITVETIEEAGISSWPEHSTVVIMDPGYPWYQRSELVRQFAKSRVQVILITCTDREELDCAVDVVIHIPGMRSSLDSIAVGAVFSILALEYRMRYIDQWYYQ